ncbi:retrovirus-related pol polyprotein from transposon TNT 1-94 [Tanacetum coccineum]
MWNHNPHIVNKRTAHSAYIKHSQEEAAVLRDLVDHIKANYPLDPLLEYSLPLRKSSALDNKTPKPVITLVYIRKPRKSKTSVPVNNYKVIKFVTANNSEPSQSRGSIVSNVPSSALDECRSSNCPSVEDLGIIFLVGPILKFQPQSFVIRQDTCYIRNLEGVDLLTGSRWTNLYTLSIWDKVASLSNLSLVKASKLSLVMAFVVSLIELLGAKTLREYYEKVGISYETSVARSPQQNGVVERRNCTLIKAACTMLIYAKAPLFLWAKAVTTACYTQNRSMIRRRHGKTPYELLHNKPPDLSYLHMFGAPCYPTNDNENLGKLQPKADIGIFIGYAPTKKAFRIYNRCTRRIVKRIHFDFDDLTTMALNTALQDPHIH